MSKTQTKPEAGEASVPATVTGTSVDLVTLDEAALLDMMAGDQKFVQTFSSDQMVIPRLLLLQDLSPQVKENKAEYIEGARPGMFCLPLIKGLTRAVDFIPARFDVRYLAWRPRKDGGGLVSSTLTLQDVEENFTQDGPGSWVGMMAPRPGEQAITVEIKETPEWIGMVSADGWPWTPCSFSFGGTKAAVARQMNTLISLQKVQTKSGERITPPSFYHVFRFTSAFEERDAGDFWAPIAARTDWVKDRNVLADARQLAASAMRGEVVADDEAGA